MMKIKHFLLFMLFAVLSCATMPGKYNDVREVLKGMIRTYEVFIDEIDAADEPKKITRSIYKFVDQMKKWDEKGRDLDKKYPELNDDKKVPKDILGLVEKLAGVATSERTKATSIIILSFTSDPEVKAASLILSEFLDGK